VLVHIRSLAEVRNAAKAPKFPNIWLVLKTCGLVEIGLAQRKSRHTGPVSGVLIVLCRRDNSTHPPLILSAEVANEKRTLRIHVFQQMKAPRTPPMLFSVPLAKQNLTCAQTNPGSNICSYSYYLCEHRALGHGSL
jgi:hypothetical protein